MPYDEQKTAPVFNIIVPEIPKSMLNELRWLKRARKRL